MLFIHDVRFEISAGFSGMEGMGDSINTCRLRLTPATGLHIMFANALPGLRSIFDTLATGNPGG